MRGFAAIGLINPKDAGNIGGIARAVGCYGASMMAIQGSRFRKIPTDTQKTWRHTPIIECDDLHDVIPYGCTPVAVDLIEGAKLLPKFVHPERAFYIFGPEDGTLGEGTLAWCKHTIYVPTIDCMNLAAAVNVVLYDRLAKETRDEMVYKKVGVLETRI